MQFTQGMVYDESSLAEVCTVDSPAIIGSLCLLTEAIVFQWLMESYHSPKFYRRHPEKRKPATAQQKKTPMPRTSAEIPEVLKRYKLPEITVELLLEVLIFTVEFSTEQMDMPHNFYLGLFCLVFGVGLAIRILYIALFVFPLWEALSKGARLALMFLVILILSGVLGGPVFKAWRKPWVNVTFRDDPDLTWWRKQVITHDISGMRDYFVILDLPTPDVPSFTVTDAGLEEARNTGPLYRDYLQLQRSKVSRRDAATDLYVNQVLRRVFMNLEFEKRKLAQGVMFESAGRLYFQASYWEHFDESAKEPFSTILWDIRGKLGQGFTDRLVSHFVRIYADTPNDVYDEDVKITFVNGLREADKDLESKMQSWPTIESTIKHYRFNATIEER